jgi:hypothetical protein
VQLCCAATPFTRERRGRLGPCRARAYADDNLPSKKRRFASLRPDLRAISAHFGMI